MAPSSIPLLLPYTAPQPAGSFTLCTSVLGATDSWLLIRMIHDVLYSGESNDEIDSPNRRLAASAKMRNPAKKVILVSFMKSWEFWRSEARRIGLDLTRLSKEGAFVFVDGMTELFNVNPQNASHVPTRSPAPGPARPTPARPGSQTLPIRGAPGLTGQPPRQAPIAHRGVPSMNGEHKKLHWIGEPEQALDGIQKDIEGVIDFAKVQGQGNSEVHLIIDQPDVLLAAGCARKLGATEMNDFILALRERVHSAVTAISADSPLIHNTLPGSTPLDLESVTFAASLAYQANMVISLRCLDTGVAKDVSGVLRVSRGGQWAGKKGSRGDWEEKELLYLVKGDGAVMLFGRGEAH